MEKYLNSTSNVRCDPYGFKLKFLGALQYVTYLAYMAKRNNDITDDRSSINNVSFKIQMILFCCFISYNIVLSSQVAVT